MHHFYNLMYEIRYLSRRGMKTLHQIEKKQSIRLSVKVNTKRRLDWMSLSEGRSLDMCCTFLIGWVDQFRDDDTGSNSPG